MQLPADMILSVSEVQKTSHEGSVPDLSVVFCCVVFFSVHGRSKTLW